MTKAGCLILLAALLTLQAACAQSQGNQDKTKSTAAAASPAATRRKAYPNLKTQAGQWAEAYVRKDYPKVASLMNPKQVELAGGLEQAARILSSNLERGGVTMLEIQVM